MDYISQKLGRKIELYKDRLDYGNLKLYLQVKLEYDLILIMAYLWNQNIRKLSDEKQQLIYKMIKNPSIGEIVNINRELDIDKKFMGIKKVRETMNKYPSFRNDKIGHGYSFEDDNAKFAECLEQMLDELDNNVALLKNNYDIVNIEKNIDGILEGVLYSSDGNFNNWKQREVDCSLKKALYLKDESNSYFKISPFIYVENDNVYTFRCIDEILLGKFKYNRLFETGDITKEWDDFKSIYVSEDDFKKVSMNGTIVNSFENNYSSFQYIEVKSIQKKIDDFIKNRSCVYATLWGHGGVGKTAAVQNYCEKLETDAERKFDYILFVSAKDRLYDAYTGTIKPINNSTTFGTMIKNLNRLIRNEDGFDIEVVNNSDAKILIIIDDFETFSIQDKEDIEKFVRTLDINKHKVLITTRANSILGEEIKTNELNLDETTKFLIEIYKVLFKDDISRKLNDVSMEKIHNITSGRPIFVLQFAHICSRLGIYKAVEQDIKNSKEAIDFLYGRIYNYMDNKEQKIFEVLGLLADSDDMTNLLDKVKYILDMENDTCFENYIKNIEKLRLIEIIDGKFYKVYSEEILKIMRSYFENNNVEYKDRIRERIYRISKDKNLDNDHALLANANSSRYSKSEQEVVELYKNIIDKKNTKVEIKVQALLNMAEYLYNDRGNKKTAIVYLDKYYYEYNNEPSYIKMYSSYLKGNQNTEKAINILMEFFAKSRDFKDSEILELFGLLVTHKSLYWIELREETKSGFKYDEIYEDDYNKQIQEQTKEFRSIKNKQGNKLIKLISEINFEEISMGARQNLISAAYQYIEICIRLQDWQNAKYLCSYIRNNLSKYVYGFNFEQKEKRIDRYEKQSRRRGG